MNCSTQIVGLGFSLKIFLGMLTSLMSKNLQWSSQPQLAGGCGVFIGGDPNGEMSEVTRCGSLMCVHNGRISNHNATLLEEQESRLTEWVLSWRHKVRWLCLRATTYFSEISLIRLSLWVFVLSWASSLQPRSQLANPLDSTIFPMTQEYKRN